MGRSTLLRAIADDLGTLFSASRSTTWALLSASVLLQVGYWYVGAPGPATPRGLEPALTSILWAALMLGVIPYLLARLLRIEPASLGLQRGELRASLEAIAMGLVVVIPVAYLAGADAEFQSTYPWAGTWAGNSVPSFLLWAGAYGLYYVCYEFFYRGFLLRGLEPALGRETALWLQAVASTLLHLGKPLPEALAALPAGLLFGLVAFRTRSLLAPVLIHFALGVATDFFSLLHSGAWR